MFELVSEKEHVSCGCISLDEVCCAREEHSFSLSGYFPSKKNMARVRLKLLAQELPNLLISNMHHSCESWIIASVCVFFP